MEFPALTPSEKLAVGGSLLAIVGSLLPWLSAPNVTVPGFVGDGFMAIMFAVPVLGIVALWEWGLIQQVVTAVLGALISLVAGNYALSVGTPGAGLGVYLAFVAGVLVAGAGVLGVLRSRRNRAENTDQRPQVE